MINRDTILEVIKSSNIKLNPKEILDKIKKENTVDELRDLIHELDLMCRDGILRMGSGNTYLLNDLIVGVMDFHSKGNGHVILRDGDDVFIPRNLMKDARDKDTVAIEMTDKNRNEGKVVKVLKRSLGRSIGEVVNDNGRFYVKVLDTDLPYKVVVDIDPELNLVDGLLVHLDYVEDIDKNRVLARIDSIICHKNAPGNTSAIAIIGSEFKRRVDIPEEVAAEGRKFRTHLTPEEVKEGIEKDKRVDLRGEVVTTTDGKDTKDIDDGNVSYMLPNGNYCEIVTIADVSHYVKMGSAIWNFAYEKGNSDYPANKVGPMLPIELSNGICSLNPNEDRFAVCVKYEMDHAGRIIKPEVFMAVIQSKKKMNYDAVQDIIENKITKDTEDYTTVKYTVKAGETLESVAFKYMAKPEELITMKDDSGKIIEINKPEDFKAGNEVNIPVRRIVKNSYLTSKIQGDNLRRRGKLDFDSREKKHIFDENDKVIDVVPRVQREAERIIENKMIYANEAFTMFMVSKLQEITTNMVPFVFRTHGEPNAMKIEEFLRMLEAYGIILPFEVDPENVTNKQVADILDALKDKTYFTAFSQKLLRCMQKARYTPENYGHYGVASENYTHFTSPIRRMADLLVHTIYKVFIHEENHDTATLKYWADYLKTACEHITECEIAAAEYERAVDDYCDACYLEDKVGAQFEATIDELFPSGFFAKTTDKYIDGRVDYFLSEDDAEELKTIKDPVEAKAFIDEHVQLIDDYYDYNEKMYGYQRNGRMCLRFGDRINVACIGANPEARQVDFALIKRAA